VDATLPRFFNLLLTLILPSGWYVIGKSRAEPLRRNLEKQWNTYDNNQKQQSIELLVVMVSPK
jgi:hypothetical protein